MSACRELPRHDRSEGLLAIALVLASIYAVPFVVYGLFAVTVGLRPPGEASLVRTPASVFVS